MTMFDSLFWKAFFIVLTPALMLLAVMIWAIFAQVTWLATVLVFSVVIYYGLVPLWVPLVMRRLRGW